MEYVLGADIGTGSVKMVAVNLKLQVFETSQHHYPSYASKPGFHEQDPEQIWEAFIAALKTITDKTGASPAAIGLSCAMHSLIPVDENCMPLAPMMTWADSRSSEIAKRLSNSASSAFIYEATGTPIHSMSPLCKLIWLKENNAALFNKTSKFISIKEFIWYKLFKEFKVDHSIASCTGLFDIVRRIWHPVSLTLAGITDQLLSQPVPTGYTRMYNPLGGNPQLNFLKSEIPVVIGASDGCLANLGSLAHKPGTAVVTIGTSGAVRIADTKPLPNQEAMTFSYILDERTFICGGPVNNGGIALQWWLKSNSSTALTDKDYENAFRQISNVPPGSEGLIFLPYLTGERAPIWDSESCGVFFGVKIQHAHHHFLRAVLEGICYAVKDVLDTVLQNSGPLTQINITGGFIRADVWVQTLADITGKELTIIQTEDASSVGAAFMAMKSTGLIPGYPARNNKNLKTVTPNPLTAGIYSSGFLIFKQLYANLKQTMHQANQTDS